MEKKEVVIDSLGKGRGPGGFAAQGNTLYFFCSQPKNVDLIVAAHEEHNKNTIQMLRPQNPLIDRHYSESIRPHFKIMLVATVHPTKDERVKGLALA